MHISLALSTRVAIALTLGVGSSAVAQTTNTDPLATRFRSVWAADQCVQQRGQTWDDYRGWLVSFYTDSNGWTATSRAITAKIADAALREQTAKVLDVVGARVAGEWAKDNSCRKIRTTTGFFNAGESGKPALSTWRSELLTAAAADSGDGASITAAVARIRREVDLVLRPPA